MRVLAELAFDAIQDNPSVAAGICAFAVAFSLVAGNALYGQESRHPGPLFATRDAITTKSLPDAKAKPVRTSQAKEGGKAVVNIPVPQSRPKATDTALVRRMQSGLLELGIYAGEVDGLNGPKTREAVMKFERSLGIEPTGAITADLAAQLPDMKTVQSNGKAEAAEPVDVVTRIEERIAPVSNDAPEITISAKEPANADLDVRDEAVLLRIKIGLMNDGAEGISLTGALDEATIKAIREFQGRHGLTVNGVPGEEILAMMQKLHLLSAI
jgi:peptidoglycan hydrolase-like protein with peptidoglycan-binding domain